MTDDGTKQRKAETPKRGEAAWRAHREAIASRNERATRQAQARRRDEYERVRARELDAERRERAELAKRSY